MYTYDDLGTINPATLDDDEFEAHVTFADGADGSQWGHTIMMLAVGARSEASYCRDPEAIRCAETGYSPADIYLGQRQYTDDQLGCLDGPMRDAADKALLTPKFSWTARTPKARMTKRQRRKLRKERRAAKRAALCDHALSLEGIETVTVSSHSESLRHWASVQRPVSIGDC